MFQRIQRSVTVVVLILLPQVVVSQETPTAASMLKISWVNPPAKAPTGIEHGVFHSQCMNTSVGYNIYLPPSYKAVPSQKFPVVYFLHGSDGNESRSIQLSSFLHNAILESQVPPMLMVFVNGGRNSGYIDSVDGTVLPETMIVSELIPHIDASYRTIAQRGGRAVQGFSMGGGGALRLASKFPELFSSVVVWGAGGVREFDRFPTEDDIANVKKAERKMPVKMIIMGNDLAHWQETSTWNLLEKNRDQIAGRLPIRMVIGTEDFSLEGSKQARDRLSDLKIGYEFKLVQGPEHNINKLYADSGVSCLQWHAEHFSPSDSSSE